MQSGAYPSQKSAIVHSLFLRGIGEIVEGNRGPFKTHYRNLKPLP